MLIDSTLQSFLIPEKKKERFTSLREGVLIRKSSIPLKSLQRLMGKCILFSLTFPGAKFYIREMAQAIVRASPKGEIQSTAGPREELEFWRFLDEWDRHIPWKDEKHWVLSVSTDASLSRWAVVIHCQPNDVVLGDYWESDLEEFKKNSVVTTGHSRLSSGRASGYPGGDSHLDGAWWTIKRVDQSSSAHFPTCDTEKYPVGTVLCPIQEQSC